MVNLSSNSDLSQRIKTAAILIFVFLGLIAWASNSALGAKCLSAIVFVLLACAAFELVQVPKEQSRLGQCLRFFVVLLPSFFTFLFFGWSEFSSSLSLYMSALMGFFSLASAALVFMNCTGTDQSTVIEDLMLMIARDLLALLLLGLGGSAAVLIARISPAMALALVATVAVADSAAYFAGSAWGGAKVAGVVSPKKTWVGTFAGIFTGALVGSLLLMLPTVGCFLIWPLTFLASMLLVLASQAGDFAKSAIKRLYDIKDFGRILPGHGGIFDRLDGILGAAPAALALLVLSCSL